MIHTCSMKIQNFKNDATGSLRLIRFSPEEPISQLLLSENEKKISACLKSYLVSTSQSVAVALSVGDFVYIASADNTYDFGQEEMYNIAQELIPNIPDVIWQDVSSALSESTVIEAVDHLFAGEPHYYEVPRVSDLYRCQFDGALFEESGHFILRSTQVLNDFFREIPFKELERTPMIEDISVLYKQKESV